MRIVVAAVIEREDRRIFIGQRRRNDTSPMKWEFPGGKVEEDETRTQALSRELREELGVTLRKSVLIGRVEHRYANHSEMLEIYFYAVDVLEREFSPKPFAATAWVLPKELGDYDFLTANTQMIAQLATGRIKPAELLLTAPARQD